MKRKDLDLLRNAADAMFCFIQKYPPPGFDAKGMGLLVMTGRLEELPGMLESYEPCTYQFKAETQYRWEGK